MKLVQVLMAALALQTLALWASEEETSPAGTSVPVVSEELVAGKEKPAAPEAVPADFPLSGKVAANRLNVRARPGTHYEVIGRFEIGQTVTVVGVTGDWFEVRVPRDAKAWVAERFVGSSGTITADNVRVRAGAGLAFTPYAYVNEGDVVTTVGAPFNGWQQIEAPETATAWVSREFVELEVKVEEVAAKTEAPVEETPLAATGEDQESGQEPLAEKAAEGVETPVVEVVPSEKRTVETEPAEPETVVVQPIQPPGQAGAVMRDGMIMPVKEIVDAVATHALVRQVEGITITLCYLNSRRIDLSQWEARGVRIYGTEMWYHGWRRPVIEVTGIQLQPAQPQP